MRLDLDACVKVPDREVPNLDIRRAHRHEDAASPLRGACAIKNCLVHTGADDGHIVNGVDRLIRLSRHHVVGSSFKINRVLIFFNCVYSVDGAVERGKRISRIPQVEVVCVWTSDMELPEIGMAVLVVRIGACLEFSQVRPPVTVGINKGNRFSCRAYLIRVVAVHRVLIVHVWGGKRQNLEGILSGRLEPRKGVA